MTKRKTTYTRRVERANEFKAAHMAIVSIVAVFGAASVVGVVLTVNTFDLPDVIRWPLMVLASILALCVALVPVLMAPAWATAKGSGLRLAGLVLILPMMGLDASLQSNGAYVADSLVRAERVADAKSALSFAQAKADAVPMVDLSDRPGPQTTASRNKVRNDALAPLLVDRDKAQAALDAANVSSLPLVLILSLMGGFQLATFFARAWLSSVTAQKREALKAERRAVALETEKRKEKQRKADAKTKAKKTAPARSAPYLAFVANDC